ncbi:hypothetical protein N0V90_006535 [Kalmusia sp. IMI 367209]|nr:hypothetical protein N0V90_006535 [Kalmusia sp. IMI 367209]
MAVDLLILSTVFMSITIISIAIRIFTRVFILKNLGIDDYLICAGAVFAIVCSSTPIAALSYGLGHPLGEQKPEEVAPYQKLILTSSVAYTVSATFIKLSLLMFYTRLSTGQTFLALVYIGILIVTGFGIGSVAAVLLQCIPLSMLWDDDKKGHCIRLIDFYYANAAINIVTDITILLLPIKILWGLHMPLRQRISLCALFGLGGLYVAPSSFYHNTISAPYNTFSLENPPLSGTNTANYARACVASIIRLSALKSLLASDDPTINLVTPLNWSIIEVNTSIFIAGAPALKAFLRRCMPTLLGSSYSPTGKTQYGSKSRPTHHNSIPLGSISGKSATKWTSNTAYASGPEDNESQENIYQSYHGILQEVTVTVASERKSLDTQEGRSVNDTKADF